MDKVECPDCETADTVDWYDFDETSNIMYIHCVNCGIIMMRGWERTEDGTFKYRES